MTLEERRAKITYDYRRHVNSPPMGNVPIDELWPDGIERPTAHGVEDPPWTDDEMDRIEATLDAWGITN